MEAKSRTQTESLILLIFLKGPLQCNFKQFFKNNVLTAKTLALMEMTLDDRHIVVTPVLCFPHKVPLTLQVFNKKQWNVQLTIYGQ